MTTNTTFVISAGKDITTQEFKIADGLQQGTVNAPIWFNIYTHELLNLFGQNKLNDTLAIAFADDYIAYVGDKYPSTIQPERENISVTR